MVDETAGAHPGGPVFVHVGLPKTGTTFLQRLLRDNRELLAEHGVRYPVRGPATMFHGAIEVREAYQTWGFSREQIGGTWEWLCQQARDHAGPTILGHEILAAATRAQVERVATDLADVELHLVVTTRDLGRQIPAWWQEWIKNQHGEGFTETMERQILPGWDGEGRKSTFWRSQDLRGVLRRWSAAVPAERMHVVTAPPPGSDPRELWRRFADATRVPAGLEVDPGPRSNESLGITEVALLRATNQALDGRLVQPHYGPVVKHWFAESVLSPRTSPRPQLPAEWRERVREMTAAWRDYIEEAGVQVHGSLDDLEPTIAPDDVPGPDDVTAQQIAELAPRVMAEMLLEVTRLRQEGQEARRELAHAQQPRGARRLVRRVLGGVKRRLTNR